MTNEPEPNTRAGEALLDSAVEQMGEALFNLSSRLKLAGTFTAGSPGDRNAVSYEKVVLAWQKLTGEIERSKLPTWDHYAEEPVTSDMVPRDVAESWKAKAENYQIERAELLADISDMMANHVENWPSPKRLKTAVALIDKTFHAQSAQIAKLQADGDKMAGALERSRQGWSNVLELGLLPVQHQSTALGLQEAAATVIQQAFAEREVGMIEALKPFAHYYRLNDCEGRPDDDAIEVPIGDLRFAALALAAKGDSRG